MRVRTARKLTVLLTLLAALVCTVGCRATPTAPRAVSHWVIVKETPIFSTSFLLPSRAGATPSGEGRYDGIQMTDKERTELAQILFLEANTEPLEGQQAVVEVVFNRVLSDRYPDNVHDVLAQSYQFSTWDFRSLAKPTYVQTDIINAAFEDPHVVPADVLYFSQAPTTANIWGTIGNHVFCK